MEIYGVDGPVVVVMVVVSPVGMVFGFGFNDFGASVAASFWG